MMRYAVYPRCCANLLYPGVGPGFAKCSRISLIPAPIALAGGVRAFRDRGLCADQALAELEPIAFGFIGFS